jgi:predicted HicB family RNase H-like nuclease
MTHGNKGNENARKDPSERANRFLHLRVRDQDKRLWEACARSEGLTLSQWVVGCLNAAVEVTENGGDLTINWPIEHK